MMHLVGHWLSTTGKKRGKKKFRNAEAAQKAREEKQAWQELEKKWSTSVKCSHNKNIQPLDLTARYKPYRRETETVNSLNNGVDMGVAIKKQSPVYTGTLIKGVSQMHKSNAVPVIDEQHIIDIARMRR